jgi:hypothetical protein
VTHPSGVPAARWSGSRPRRSADDGRAAHPARRLRLPGGRDPCGGGWTGSRARRGCASAGGIRGSCADAGCSAGTYACSRVSPVEGMGTVRDRVGETRGHQLTRHLGRQLAPRAREPRRGHAAPVDTGLDVPTVRGGPSEGQFRAPGGGSSTGSGETSQHRKPGAACRGDTPRRGQLHAATCGEPVDPQGLGLLASGDRSPADEAGRPDSEPGRPARSRVPRIRL